MKIIDCVQGSPEWESARLGIPTASAYDRIITPRTLKPSTSAGKYRNELLACWVVGYQIDFSGSSGAIDRGREQEPQARAHYELRYDVEVQTVGFITTDDGRTGGSPDGLIGEDGGGEFKVPLIHTHIGYLLEPQLLADAYRCQVQGYMYLTDRAWWDIYAYNSELPSVRVRVERDEKFIEVFDGLLWEFTRELDKAKAELAPHRREPMLMPAGAFEEDDA